MIKNNLAAELCEDWYLANYPMARKSIRSGVYSSAAEHFLKLGFQNGYLPFEGAERFGGDMSLYNEEPWFTSPDAQQMAARMLREDSISQHEFDALARISETGYVILPNALDPALVAECRREIAEIYNNKLPGAKFAWAGGSAWKSELLKSPGKALDTHIKSRVILETMMSPSVIRFLNILFGESLVFSQSLAFLRGSSQALHQDIAYVDYSRPRFFTGVWLALEDVKPGAGELLYSPGSHRLPSFQFGDRFLSISEAHRHGLVDDRQSEVNRYVSALKKNIQSNELEVVSFLPRAGDVLIWTSSLAHGGASISLDDTRVSLVTHVCPGDVVPTYFERKHAPLHEFGEGAYYSTFAYSKSR